MNDEGLVMMKVVVKMKGEKITAEETRMKRKPLRSGRNGRRKVKNQNTQVQTQAQIRPTPRLRKGERSLTRRSTSLNRPINAV